MRRVTEYGPEYLGRVWSIGSLSRNDLGGRDLAGLLGGTSSGWVCSLASCLPVIHRGKGMVT